MFEEMSQKKKISFTIMLILPLVLAIAWIIYIKATEDIVGAGMGSFLSPIDNTPVIVSLTLFVLGYLFFLGIMFYSNIKEMISKKIRGY